MPSKAELATRRAAELAIQAAPAYADALAEFRRSFLEQYKRVYEAARPLLAARRNDLIADAVEVWDAGYMKEKLFLDPDIRALERDVRKTKARLTALLRDAEEEDLWES